MMGSANFDFQYLVLQFVSGVLFAYILHDVTIDIFPVSQSQKTKLSLKSDNLVWQVFDLY